MFIIPLLLKILFFPGSTLAVGEQRNLVGNSQLLSVFLVFIHIEIYKKAQIGWDFGGMAIKDLKWVGWIPLPTIPNPDQPPYNFFFHIMIYVPKILESLKTLAIHIKICMYHFLHLEERESLMMVAAASPSGAVKVVLSAKTKPNNPFWRLIQLIAGVRSIIHFLDPKKFPGWGGPPPP